MAAHKHWGMTPQFNNIPDEIKGIDHWVLWKAVKEPGGRMAKRPYTTRGKLASHSDPKTWSPFEDVRKEFVKGGYDGVGFVVTNAPEELTIIDLDKCRDEVTGEVEPWAQAIVDAADTYTELSPSGTGLHLVTLGDAGAFINHGDQGLEVYTQESRRFMTITGHLPASEWCEKGVKDHVAAALLEELKPMRPTPRGEGQTTAEKVTESPEGIRRILLSMDLTKHEDYSEWLELGMALHHQFDGSDEGLELWDECSQAMSNYEGRDILDIKWDSFGGGTGTITLKTFFMRAKAQGVDIRPVTDPGEFPDLSDEDPFEDHSDTGYQMPGWLEPCSAANDKPLPEELVEGVLALKENSILAGMKNAGKTFVASELARCISTGERFFGRRVLQGPVLYLVYEGSTAVDQRKRAWVAQGLAVDDRLRTVGPQFMPKFNFNGSTVKGDERPGFKSWLGETFKHFVRKYGRPPVLVIVDTLKAATPGNDEDVKGMDAAAQSSREMVSKYNTHCMLVQHTTKGGGTVRGHSALSNDADTVLFVRQDEKGRWLDAENQRSFESGPVGGFVLQSVDTGRTTSMGRPERSAIVSPLPGVSEADPGTFDEIGEDGEPVMVGPGPLPANAADLKKRILEAIEKWPSGDNFTLNAGGWETVTKGWAARWMRERVEESHSKSKDLGAKAKSAISSAVGRAVAKLEVEHEHRAAEVTLHFIRSGNGKVLSVEVHRHQWVDLPGGT